MTQSLPVHYLVQMKDSNEGKKGEFKITGYFADVWNDLQVSSTKAINLLMLSIFSLGQFEFYLHCFQTKGW